VQVAFTWDGTVGTAAGAHLFVNGVEQAKVSSSDGSGTLGYANATNQPFRIGNADFDFPGSLTGKMAYLAVYKGTILSTTEMGQLDAQLPITSSSSQALTPSIISLAPTSGAIGASVTITGANFGAAQGSSSVSFDGVTADSITSWQDGQIVVTVPSNATTGPVTVFANGLQSNQNVIFTVNPVVLTLSPSSGPTTTQVQIGGTGFGTSQGTSTVAFNGVTSPVVSWSPTSITAFVPPGATTGNVVVTVDGVAATGPSFTVTEPPTPITPNIASISASSGSPGQQVAIQGTGFGTTQGTGNVLLGTTLGSVVSWGDQTIQATVSAGSTSGVVQVQQGGISSNSIPFTVSTTSIDNIQPNHGLAGTSVTIDGSGFGATQGNGIAWIGTAAAIVTNWSDGSITASVAAGSASGTVQVLQNGTWSNSVPFTIDTPYIKNVNPTGGAAGTAVTATGSGFGSTQGNGSVSIGGAPGIVTGWSDTQVVASVASSAVSGVVKVQQGGIWSNAVTFTVPVTFGGGTQVTLVPNVISMVVGDTRTIEAVNGSGQSVTGLTWTSSDTTIVTLSTDDPPIITAVAPGNATITAGNASADVTVYAGPTLPVGTVIWSNPGDGSGVSSIVPAVPSATGVADVFALNADCNLQAVTSDGTVAWTANVGTSTDQSGNSSCNQFLPDFQGGVVVNTGQSIYRLDGVTGAPYPAYGSFENCFTTPVVHTNGTIFVVMLTYVYPPTLCNYATLHPFLTQQYGSWWLGNTPGSSAAIVAINPLTGQQNFSVSMENSTFTVPGESISPNGSSTQPPSLGTPIIAGDGYLYVPYQYAEYSVNTSGNFYDSTAEHSRLLRVGPAGDSSELVLEDLTGTTFAGSSGSVSNASMPSLITNSDQGILASYAISSSNETNGAPTSNNLSFNLATASGTSLTSKVQMAGVPSQQGPITPVLQAQDDSFVGTVSTQSGSSMIAFDQSGNTKWMQPGYTPQIATSDGGVIAPSQSGQAVTFDQNGNVTGQIANMPTQSWFGNAYLGNGAIFQVTDAMPASATEDFWVDQDANQSHNDAAVEQVCPKTVTVNLLYPQSLPDNDFPEMLTGVGALAEMEVGPAGPDYSRTVLRETVTPTSNSCPSNIQEYTSFPTITIANNSTFLVGSSAHWEGEDYPSQPNEFYDSHRLLGPINVLGQTSVQSCVATATQTYSCNGNTIGTFTLTNTYTRGTLPNGKAVTNVTVGKTAR
jgi:hypothetical protein